MYPSKNTKDQKEELKSDKPSGGSSDSTAEISMDYLRRYLKFL